MSETANFGGFTNYKQTVIELTGDLKQLHEYSKRLKLNGNMAAIEDVLTRLTQDTFNVAIIGEFNRGKSTLINALLGKDVLPMNVLPTTAILNKITYSISPFVTIEYKNGKTEQIAIDQLNNYVTKLTKESEERSKSIKEATVYYPINYCKNGVTIIDTPGLNDDEAMTEVTMSVLPQTDAALMVIMAQSPFSESERDFLESKVISSDLGRVLFVVTGIDLLEEEDVEVVLNHITKTIQEHILKKAENTYGKNSKEFEAYKCKLGKVRVYGISAKKALRAKLKQDQEMLNRSCFPAFETALENFLTEDRGAVMLNVPVNRIKTASVEILKAVQLRDDVLNMQKEEFHQKYDSAMEEIECIRQERTREFERINESSQLAFRELRPRIVSFWPSLEAAASQAIDSFVIGKDDLKEDNFARTQEAILKSVTNAMTKEGQRITEQIQEFINQSLAQEAERLSGFENSFYEATDKIQNLFSNTRLKSNGGSDGDTMISAVANSVVGFGLGGVYMGFKEAGWKGALLGGATGIAGMAIGNIGMFGILLPALAIPITWPIAIIGGIAVGILSTFSSKWALNKVFSKGKIEKFKESVTENVLSEINKMKASDNFSETIKNQVEVAFEALKNKIRTETEHILGDTQNQLTQLKVDMAQTNLSREKEKEELTQMLTSMNEICNRADGISKQLAVILTR